VRCLGTCRLDGPASAEGLATGGNSSGTCSGCSESVILQ